jgi:hypothetical protein
VPQTEGSCPEPRFVPRELTVTFPAIVAVPYTAKITGRSPVAMIMPVLGTLRSPEASTTASRPSANMTVVWVGRVTPLQPVKVPVVEL